MFKRFVAGALIAVSALVGMVPSAFAADYMTNGSMGTIGSNGDPAGWSRGGYGDNDRKFSFFPDASTTTCCRTARIDVTKFVSGDAKWISPAIPVTGGKKLEWWHSFRSNVKTTLTARFTIGGTYKYVLLNTLPATDLDPDHLASIIRSITVPPGATSMNVYHSIAGVGHLEVAGYIVADEPFRVGNDASDLIFPLINKVDANNQPVGWHHAGIGEQVRLYETPYCKTFPSATERYGECPDGMEKYLSMAFKSPEKEKKASEAYWYTDNIPLRTVPTNGKFSHVDLSYSGSFQSPLIVRVTYIMADGSRRFGGTAVDQQFATGPFPNVEWRHFNHSFEVLQGAKAVSFAFVKQTTGSGEFFATRLARFELKQDDSEWSNL